MKLTYIDHSGTDLSVVNAARVSFGKKHTEFHSEKDTKLINYLATHEHLSPFNHCFLTCHVKAPIFVARQLVKHEYMPWNEISRRYVDDEPEFYTPERWRAKAEDKKQGSIPWVDGGTWDHEDVESVGDDNGWSSSRIYKELLEMGVAPEQARMVLPLNTYTEWYWSGTLGAWMKMYNLRIKEDTQEETRFVAKQAGEVLQKLYPVSFEALRKDT